MARTTPPTTTDLVAEHAEWHADVEARRTAPYGPLSVTALHWLTDEPQRFDGIPGRWSATAEGVVEVDLDGSGGGDDHVQAVLDDQGRERSGAERFGPLTGIESTTLSVGALRIELAARGGGIALRIRDPESADRRGYLGTATFPVDPAWVIDARFVPDARAAVPVDSIVPDRPQEYDSPGVAEFELDGATHRLVLFPGAGDGLRAIFADASGRDRTFPAARSVEVVRTADDAVRIDFNRATNPPCAYSAGATCPLPPAGNRLAVRIEAGELRPAAPA